MDLHLRTRMGSLLDNDTDLMALHANVNHLNVIYRARGGSPMALADTAADVAMEEFDVDMSSISAEDILT
eukprot:6846358-Heterocapsa_arctica.AAC.1